MARDLAGWAQQLDTLADATAFSVRTSVPDVAEFVVPLGAALAAVLRAVAAQHRLCTPDYYELEPVLAALAPLAPLFPEGGTDV